MSNQKKPRFSQEQIEYLERVFPEPVGLDDLPTLYSRLGQRQVLAHIKSINNVEVRLVPVQRDLQ
jgi:hypothetical protein